MTTLGPVTTGKRPIPHAQPKRKKRRKKKARKFDPPKGSTFMTIPDAGRKYFGLSKNGSYDAAARGDLGRIIEIGRRRFVSVAAIESKAT
jgi:hypothetical protein